MRIACLVTVCAFLLSSVFVAEASLVNGSKRGKSDSRQVQLRTSTVEGKTNTTASYEEPLQAQRRTRTTTHASITKGPRRPVAPQTSSNQTSQMQSNKRDRSHRQMGRGGRTRQSRTSRSFDLSDNQIEELPVLPSKFIKEGAIYIEPIARVVTKKSLLDSFMDLMKRAFEPSEQKLGPLVGPINFPGVGDKVYVRLLESSEHGPNHVTLRLITREPVPLIEHDALSSAVIKDDSFDVVKGETFSAIKGDAFHGIKDEGFGGFKGGAFDAVKGENFGVIKGDTLHAVLSTATVLDHTEALGSKYEHHQLLSTPLFDANTLDAANRHRRLVPHSTRPPYNDLAGQESKKAARGAQKERPVVERPKTSSMKEHSGERLKGATAQKEVLGEDGEKETIVTGTRLQTWVNMVDAPVRPPLNSHTPTRQRYPAYSSQVESQKPRSREVYQQSEEQGAQSQTRYVTQSSNVRHGGSGGGYSGGYSGGTPGTRGNGNVVNEPMQPAGAGNVGGGVRYPVGNGANTGQEPVRSTNNLRENTFQPSPMFQYFPEYPEPYYPEPQRQALVFPNTSRVPKRLEAHEPFDSFFVRSTINPTVLPVPTPPVLPTVQTNANYYDKSALRVIAAPNLRAAPTTQATLSYQRRTSPNVPYMHQQKQKADELMQIKAAIGELRKLEAPTDWQPVSIMNKWTSAYALSTTTDMSVQRLPISRNVNTVGYDRVPQLAKASDLDDYREKVEESKQSAWTPFVESSVISRAGSGEENRESMSVEAVSLWKKARLLANENVGFVSEPTIRAKGPVRIVKVIKKPYYPENVTTPRPVATAKPQVDPQQVKPPQVKAPQVKAPQPKPPQPKPPQPKPPQPKPPHPKPQVKPTVKPTIKPTVKHVIKTTMKPTAKPFIPTSMRFPSTTRLPPTVKFIPTPRFTPTTRSTSTTPRPTKVSKATPSSGAKSMIHKLFKSTTPRAGLRFPKLKLTTAPSAKAA